MERTTVGWGLETVGWGLEVVYNGKHVWRKPIYTIKTKDIHSHIPPSS